MKRFSETTHMTLRVLAYDKVNSLHGLHVESEVNNRKSYFIMEKSIIERQLAGTEHLN